MGLASNYIYEDWKNDYLKIREFLFQEIVQLNMNIFVINKINEFPFFLFGDIRNHFFNTVFEGLTDSTILLVNRLMLESSSDFNTLPQFKNQIFKNISDDEMKEKVKTNLKEINIKSFFKKYKDDLKYIRDYKLAHLKVPENSFVDNSYYDKKLNIIKNINEIMEFINRYFDICSLGVFHGKLVVDYLEDGIVRKKYGTDIDLIFDQIINNHVLFNMPEEQPDFWPYEKEKLTKEHLDIFNHYRHKLGKPTV